MRKIKLMGTLLALWVTVDIASGAANGMKVSTPQDSLPYACFCRSTDYEACAQLCQRSYDSSCTGQPTCTPPGYECNECWCTCD
jgi:hypothetical protein